MRAASASARMEYAPGEAWCVASGRVVLVCERNLAPDRAAALHAESAAIDSVAALRALLDAEPTALTGLIDLDDRRALLRRHGVPASVDGAPLDDRFGADWAQDETDAALTVEAGGLQELAAGSLPLEGGVVRVSAVRVHPRPAHPTGAAAAVPHAADTAPLDSGAQPVGAFGQTLPPADRAGARLRESPPDAEPVDDGTDDPIAEDRSLIDSVPGFIKPAVDLRAASTAQATAASAPAAAAAPASAASAPAAPAPGDAGDHDGMTITADEARRLREQRERRDEAAPATGPLVLSTLCPAGHVNAPGSLQCDRCGAPIDERTAAQRARPEVAVAVLPSGERVPLGRGVVLGRRPRSRRVENGRVPRLVTIDSPGEDVSRSHLELLVEDWNLVAIDLSSTNGTLLLREGAAPQRLRPEASTILQLGDRLDLGDAQIVTIEAAP
ncbi:FHA domain-containing protein [Agrococcus sp. Ld7]|uniref:FHA domain-containing protein n=1 Tax=Agrococcus sp. Ld7 TaxID=649148 RepID=UPI00386D293E